MSLLSERRERRDAFFEVGRTMVWYPGRRQQSERYGERVLVKVLRVARNGIWVEMPPDNGEAQQIRVSRRWLKYPVPLPYRPRGQPHLVYVNPKQNIPSSPRKYWLRLHAVPATGGEP
jgi:hypothetical protein